MPSCTLTSSTAYQTALTWALPVQWELSETSARPQSGHCQWSFPVADMRNWETKGHRSRKNEILESKLVLDHARDQTPSPGGRVETSWTMFQLMASLGGLVLREGGSFGTGGGGGARGSTLLFQLAPGGPEASAGAVSAEGAAELPPPTTEPAGL